LLQAELRSVQRFSYQTEIALAGGSHRWGAAIGGELGAVAGTVVTTPANRIIRAFDPSAWTTASISCMYGHVRLAALDVASAGDEGQSDLVSRT